MISFFPFSNCGWGAIHTPPYIEIYSLFFKKILSTSIKLSDSCSICLKLLFITIDESLLSTFLLSIFSRTYFSFRHFSFYFFLLLYFLLIFLWLTNISVWCVILSHVGKNWCYPNTMLIWSIGIYVVLFSFYIIVSLFLLSKIFLFDKKVSK